MTKLFLSNITRAHTDTTERAAHVIAWTRPPSTCSAQASSHVSLAPPSLCTVPRAFSGLHHHCRPHVPPKVLAPSLPKIKF